eukprot:c24929_g1_i8 orf=3988-5961(+)
MAAVIRTYERKPGFSRNNPMKKPRNTLNGYGADPLAPERSYTSETVADSSEIRRARANVSTGPCVAQNFTTISAEPPSETASEDSCSLKRKSMSLNGEVTKEGFASGYGMSLGDLSRSERRQLRKRLKMDLQQVRSLSLKVEARELQVRSFSQGSAVQPQHRSGMNGSTSNGHYFPAVAESCHREGRVSRQPSLVIPEPNFDSLNSVGKDKRTPKANQLYASSEFLSGKDKLPPPEKHRSKLGLNAKRSLHGRMDARDVKRPKVDASYGRRSSELLKQCSVILKKLMSHKFGWVFNEPVDVVKLNLHDYFKIIKKPMDLGTIKKKLDAGVYLLPTEFCEDVRLTFLNAMKYNPQGHDVYVMADTLRGMFESKWKTIEEKVKELDPVHDRFADLSSRDHHMGTIEQGLPQSTGGHVPLSTSKPAPARKAKPPSFSRSASKPKTKTAPQPKRAMTFAEKQHLSECLGNLPADKLEQAVQIMRKNPNLTQNDDEIEVDIESFDPDTLWELHRFVMDSRGSSTNEDRTMQAAPQAASEPQIPNGNPKAAKAPLRGNEGGEEEVDIGDDMPTKEFPPVVIEKDRGMNTKEGSSSSSSSSSGSSSSDSDSGSSSGSDSDADEGHSAGAVSKFSSADKEPVGSAAVGDRRGSPTFMDDGVKSAS